MIKAIICLNIFIVVLMVSYLYISDLRFNVNQVKLAKADCVEEFSKASLGISRDGIINLCEGEYTID